MAGSGREAVLADKACAAGQGEAVGAVAWGGEIVASVNQGELARAAGGAVAVKGDGVVGAWAHQHLRGVLEQGSGTARGWVTFHHGVVGQAHFGGYSVAGTSQGRGAGEGARLQTQVFQFGGQGQVFGLQTALGEPVLNIGKADRGNDADDGDDDDDFQ